MVASVSDPDSDETDQEWQWARGESAEGSFTDIEDATDPSRAPTSDDAGDVPACQRDLHGQLRVWEDGFGGI